MACARNEEDLCAFKPTEGAPAGRSEKERAEQRGLAGRVEAGDEKISWDSVFPVGEGCSATSAGDVPATQLQSDEAAAGRRSVLE